MRCKTVTKQKSSFVASRPQHVGCWLYTTVWRISVLQCVHACIVICRLQRRQAPYHKTLCALSGNQCSNVQWRPFLFAICTGITSRTNVQMSVLLCFLLPETTSNHYIPLNSHLIPSAGLDSHVLSWDLDQRVYACLNVPLRAWKCPCVHQRVSVYSRIKRQAGNRNVGLRLGRVGHRKHTARTTIDFYPVIHRFVDHTSGAEWPGSIVQWYNYSMMYVTSRNTLLKFSTVVCASLPW